MSTCYLGVTSTHVTKLSRQGLLPHYTFGSLLSWFLTSTHLSLLSRQGLTPALHLPACYLSIFPHTPAIKLSNEASDDPDNNNITPAMIKNMIAPDIWYITSTNTSNFIKHIQYIVWYIVNNSPGLRLARALVCRRPIYNCMLVNLLGIAS